MAKNVSNVNKVEAPELPEFLRLDLESALGGKLQFPDHFQLEDFRLYHLYVDNVIVETGRMGLKKTLKKFKVILHHRIAAMGGETYTCDCAANKQRSSVCQKLDNWLIGMSSQSRAAA